MRLLIFAFNPKYVNPEILKDVEEHLKKEHGCDSMFIQHLDDHSEPIYCVQWINVREFYQELRFDASNNFIK